MKPKNRLLSFTVGCTMLLLSMAGILIVVGIFNSYLNWDIFGPKIESFLYGVFGSCLALSCIGFAMTIVLGTQEIVKVFRLIQQHKTEDDHISEAPKYVYLRWMIYVILFFVSLIVILAFVNHTVQKHRSKVFKQLVSEQVDLFKSILPDLITPLTTPPRSNVPYNIYDFIKTINNISFVNKTTLYLPDPVNQNIMWGYTVWRQYKEKDGFAKFFISKDFEKSMIKAILGSESELDQLNNSIGFSWYYLVKDKFGKPIAILRVDGNPNENFRDYLLGS